MVTVVVVVVVNVCRLRKRWLFAIRQYVHYKSAFSVPRCLCAIPKYQYSITATSYPMITTNKKRDRHLEQVHSHRDWERMFICRRRWWAARWDTQQCKLQSSGTLKYHSYLSLSFSLCHPPSSLWVHLWTLLFSAKQQQWKRRVLLSIDGCAVQLKCVLFRLLLLFSPVQCVTCKDWVQVIINYSGIGRERERGDESIVIRRGAKLMMSNHLQHNVAF